MMFWWTGDHSLEYRRRRLAALDRLEPPRRPGILEGTQLIDGRIGPVRTEQAAQCQIMVERRIEAAELFSYRSHILGVGRHPDVGHLGEDRQYAV
jgi:hypothetical protein